MGKIRMTPVRDAPVFRKIAFGSWRTAGDPSVYGLVEIDVTRALEALRIASERHGVKITLAHFVGKAAAMTMAERPEINGMIRLGRIYRRESVDLFFQVNVPGRGDDKVKGANLAGAVVEAADKRSILEIAKELQARAERLRQSKDKEFSDAMKLFRGLPWWASRWLLNLTSFLNYDLNLDLAFLGIPRDPFGSVMITNVGSLGVEMAWAPLVPYTRVPLLLTLGLLRERPWVVDGRVEPRPILPIGITFDHRFMDGVHAAAMGKKFKDCFERPDQLF